MWRVVGSAGVRVAGHGVLNVRVEHLVRGETVEDLCATQAVLHRVLQLVFGQEHVGVDNVVEVHTLLTFYPPDDEGQVLGEKL